MEKLFEFKNKKQVQSRFGGIMYYLFFTDGERSYKCCVDTTFRNWAQWQKCVSNIKRGDLVKGLRVKSKGLIDADSRPRYAGNALNTTN